MSEPTIDPAVTVAEYLKRTDPVHAGMANAIRFLAADAVEAAKSGHPGMPMGMADVATVLFTEFLNVDPKASTWPDRDRFVLSAGHGSMLIYALNYLLGYPDMGIGEIRKFRQLGARTAGHPEYGHAEGIETTTGPLGQGLATAVGMALAERMLNARYGNELVDHFTYVIAGDGCLMEGISQEAIDLAGHLKLSRLIVLFDDNHISIDGPTSLSTSIDQLARVRASGWAAERVDGHDPKAIRLAVKRAQVGDKPTLIACRTTIGFGAPKKGGTEGAHGSPLGADELAAARAALGWTAPAFEVPDAILKRWRMAGERGHERRMAWEKRLAASPHKARFEAALSGDITPEVRAKLKAFRAELSRDKPSLASRKASEMALGVINAATELTVGGSADLTHSNFTVTKGQGRVGPGDYTGRYIHYGIREHGMAAAMNGIALHKGLIPYGGTFLVFADYARGAMRLSALMGQRVIYVMTHDSIGLGEDGPTHQPIEHLAMLRATPNMLVMRPADAVETAECWEIALSTKSRPSVLCLSRQNLPTFRTEAADELKSLRGAYVAGPEPKKRDVTLIATGSEVAIAFDAAKALKADGIEAAVVSMPCQELFDTQAPAYRAEVLGTAPRIAVEAASPMGWDRYIGEKGAFIGMTGFGASAPGPKLYEHFAITPEAVRQAALKLVGRA